MEKETRGRKRGFHVPPRILDDLLLVLELNGRELADKCGVSPALVAHWKKSGHVEHQHIKKIFDLLTKTQPKSDEQKAAKERACAHLILPASSGSATPVGQDSVFEPLFGSDVSTQDYRVLG